MRPSAALLLLALPAPAFAQAENLLPPPAEQLARPLRRFDANRDGLLTGDELKKARQAHNRGGRDAEPTRRWRDILGRLENDFRRRRAQEFDLNKDGRTEGPEREEMRKVWQQMAAAFTKVRDEITVKYDRNDDGELNEEERNASRQESERRRSEIEDKVINEWRGSRKPNQTAAKT